MTWRHGAACADESPELFFPIGNTEPAHLQVEKAKAVCRRCEVVDSCLKWAIESGQEIGVWGGLSEGERHAGKGRNACTRRAGPVTVRHAPSL
ncbi:MAG: WhiB family transcriptional regulator [Dermatophilaceae bacterium]